MASKTNQVESIENENSEQEFFAEPAFPISSSLRSMTFPPPPPPLPTVRAEPITSSTSYESMDQIFDPSSYTGELPAPPRRRSYTRTTEAGVDVAGEILVADGGAGSGAGAWRRHTKVFGGGVCVACVENERRMSA
ncbi:hypothetical protein PVAG01_04547 [Phlyctema vagabunda]|uniref:Uncharacterized protein n=1 Tax=Phlyctema vagabunda TaxID=108571 RepID=A0ABR4PHN1_9HELO